MHYYRQLQVMVSDWSVNKTDFSFFFIAIHKKDRGFFFKYNYVLRTRDGEKGMDMHVVLLQLAATIQTPTLY